MRCPSQGLCGLTIQIQIQKKADVIYHARAKLGTRFSFPVSELKPPATEVSGNITVHPKASWNSLIWALYQADNAKDCKKTCRFIYQVISPWERGELRRKRLGKETGLEPRMEHTMRRLTAGSGLKPDERGAKRWTRLIRDQKGMRNSKTPETKNLQNRRTTNFSIHHMCRCITVY